MTLDFFVLLNYQSSTIMSSVRVKYSVCAYFVTLLTMPDPQSSETSDVRHIRESDFGASSGIGSS